VENLARSVQVRKVEREHVNVGESQPECLDAGFVRPIADADEQRALVEPDRVSSFNGGGRLQAGCEGNAGLDEIGRHRFDLGSPPFFARTQKEHALVGDERRVVDVDRVGAHRDRGLGEDHLCAGVLELGAESLVLLEHAGWIGLCAPAVRAPRDRVLGPGGADKHSAQPAGHALAPKCPGANLHAMETTARLRTLETGGGCAAKYAAARLEELLAGFAPGGAENLLVGLDPPDDAAVYKLDEERALVVTTDFFPPLVDDPGLFGAIAATNALNDIFAMGGKPLVALSIAAFPEELPVEAVRAVFDGAAEKVREAGAVLAGGHTIRDAEPKYGLAVVGTVRPDGIWPKSGARAGDALFLTKPLGTGLVLTGVRKGALGDEEFEAAADAMTTLNDRAADALRAFEPNAVTDVTGFGLFGHAHEMAAQSGVRLALDSERLPALPGAMEMATRGLTTGGDPRNREFLGRTIEADGVPEAALTLGFDPQTGGGLLVSLPAEKAATLEAHFRGQDLLVVRVGRVEAGQGVTVT
jgi:selenide, water dikinase